MEKDYQEIVMCVYTHTHIFYHGLNYLKEVISNKNKQRFEAGVSRRAGRSVYNKNSLKLKVVDSLYMF